MTNAPPALHGISGETSVPPSSIALDRFNGEYQFRTSAFLSKNPNQNHHSDWLVPAHGIEFGLGSVNRSSFNG